MTINIEAEANKEESFTERAFRARMPSRSDSRHAGKYAQLCLDDPVPLKEVVSKVVLTLNADRESKGEELARRLVYEALLKHSPCTEDE